jgi:hypoxanthine phosphoribosyltransferase
MDIPDEPDEQTTVALDEMTCAEPLPRLSVFVIMPFGNRGEYEGASKESNYVYNEIIIPGLKLAIGEGEYCLTVTREVDKANPGSITASLVGSLAEADIVIADATGQNPNVFLELGVRYALRSKVTILMTQEPEKIPFDVKGYRFIAYNKYEPDLARQAIKSFVQMAIAPDFTSDSIVFDVFQEMSVIIPNVSESHGISLAERRETLSWDEYLARIRFLVEILEKPMKEGRFVPDALIGISNGGLIVADLIGRSAFQGTPILGFWANRRRREKPSNFWFFDNKYNAALCGALQDEAARTHPDAPIQLVLVDDHFGSGTTARHAVAFLKEKLGQNTKILYLPLVTRRVGYLEIVEEFLPYAYADAEGKTVFGISKQDFITRINTEASLFPYLGKEIAGN